MAQRKKKPEMGSERPFSDLSDDEYKALEEKARFRMNAVKSNQAAGDYVAGKGALPPVNPQAQNTLIEARGMRGANDRMAQGTRDMRERVNQVRSGEAGAKPDYSGFIPAHLKPGYQPGGPVNAVGPKVSPDVAQDILNTAEGYKSSSDYAQAMKTDPYLKDRQGTTVAITDEQRQDPAYKARVESARLAAEAHQRRQVQLNAIQSDVQDQRYREALMNRGMGIRNRAVASRERRDALTDYRREQGNMSSMTPEGRAAYLIEKNRNRQREADRNFTSRENAADRGSAEKIAQTRANAPAGNRGNVDEAQRKAWDSAARGYDPLLKELESRASVDEGGDIQKTYQDALRGQQAIRRGTPFFSGGNLDTWADDQGLTPGDLFVMDDENGYPMLYRLEGQ